MRKRLPLAGRAALGLCLLTPSGAWAKIGLAGRFGDVILEGVRPGRTYDLKSAAKVPFGVENRGDAETEVLLEFERPRAGTLAPDYEAIPDPSWFRAIPSRMRIGPKGVGFFDLVVTVPDDPLLVGKHYQVLVRGRGIGDGMLGVAVEGRVRLSLGKGPESLKAEKKRKAMQQLDFDVSPQSLYVTGVPTGKPFDTRKEARKSLRVANFAADPLAVRLSVEKWDTGQSLPEGYEPIPELGWVRLKDPELTVAPDEIEQAGLVVEVPDKPENRGRKWALMVRTGLTSGFWLDAPVKVFVETKGGDGP